MKGFNAKISRIKAVLCAVLIALCMAGCEADYVGDKTMTRGNTVITEKVYEGVGFRAAGTRKAFTIHKFEYEGHRYLYFMEQGGYAGFAGLTHDENCPCRKK